MLLSSAIDLFGDLASNIAWFFTGLSSGNPLRQWGSSF